MVKRTLAALGGMAVGLVLAFWGRAWLVERLVVRALSSMDTVPWALHNRDSFHEFLRAADPRLASALGPRALDRILKRLQEGRQLQVDLYRDPPSDDFQIVECLERAGLLRELELTPEEARRALDSMDADRRCLAPRDSHAQYHPAEAPQGEFCLASETDPLAGAILAWPLWFPHRWKHHAEFARHVASDGKALLAVHNVFWQKAVQLYLEHCNVPMENIVFLHIKADDVWVRDYGPTMVVSQGGEVAVIANPYVPLECPYQKADDQFPIEFARQLGLPVYRLPLLVEGGNIVTDGRGTILMCDSVLKRNPEISEARLREIMEAYFGCRNLILLPSLQGEVTGHADVVVKFLDPQTVAVASAQPGYRWHETFNEIANLLARTKARGGENNANGAAGPYRVVRVPIVHTRNLDPRAWGYINAFTINRKMILPGYGRHDDDVAARIYAEHLPDHDIVGVDMRNYPVGAVHCQAKELPAELAVRIP